MKYTTPEYKIEQIETQDVITASTGSATIDATGTETNVFTKVDDILNQLLLNK